VPVADITVGNGDGRLEGGGSFTAETGESDMAVDELEELGFWV
jgi:hypothetical protein